MQFVVAFLKKLPVVPIALFVVGVVLGLFIGWGTKEFENAKQVEDHVVLTESALGNREVAIVFKPRTEWPKMFKFLKLYREAPEITSSGAGGAQPP